ncbi:uncharacterized protein ACRADG_012777 isoform 1-T1 [Cochliomyia hominivorax]
MAETLTPQEVTALEEMPSVPEMGVLRKITTLQDIPLAEGDNLQQFEPPATNDNDHENERKLKTNSLKRFFRLTAKKKTGGDGPSLEAQCSNMEFDEEGVLHLNKIQQNPIRHDMNENSSLGKENTNLKRNPSNYQRSKFGFAVYKSNPPSSNKEQVSKELPVSMSKANLKSSLSSYWNSVFKQKKIKKLTKSNITLTENEKDDKEEQIINSYKCPDDIEVIPEDNCVLEDIHKLNISEEMQPK